MAKRYFLFLWLISFPFYGSGSGAAQEDSSRIRVSVVLVQLNVAVTDGKGNYISGLSPEDFSIAEDKIPEKTATFEEGNEPPRRLIDVGPSGRRWLRTKPKRRSRAHRSFRRSSESYRPVVCRRQCLHSLRHQQLHVPGIRIRAGFYRRFHSLSGRRE